MPWRRGPLAAGPPVWVEDPHFSLDYHVRHTAIPAPGGVEQLRQMAGRIFSQHLDRNKPLWELWSVEGFADGRWAPKNFPFFTITNSELTWDWSTNSSNFEQLRKSKAAAFHGAIP